ncbi:MAG: hypothetical protein ABSF10_20435 [Verrucomicrobiota bacterium]
MSTILDDQTLDFNCPTCHQKISETVGRLNLGNYTCPSCGTVFDTTNFRRDTENVEREIEDALRQIGDIKINIQL